MFQCFGDLIQAFACWLGVPFRLSGGSGAPLSAVVVGSTRAVPGPRRCPSCADGAVLCIDSRHVPCVWDRGPPSSSCFSSCPVTFRPTESPVCSLNDCRFAIAPLWVHRQLIV